MQGICHAYNSGTYLGNLFVKVKGKSRRSGKARVAVARKIFQGIYNMLKNGNYFHWKDEKNHHSKMTSYEKFLEKGYQLKKSA